MLERPSAYADLVTALLAMRSDAAIERFDAELAKAEAAGALDGPTARTLRWWQRESVRSVEEHLAGVLPDVLESLARSAREAAEAVVGSAEAWDRASGSGSDEPPPVLDQAIGSPDPGPTGGGDVRYLSFGTPSSPPPDEPPPASPPSPGSPPPAPPVGFAPRHPEARALPLDTGAPRHRLLVAGLTVLGDDGASGLHSRPTGEGPSA